MGWATSPFQQQPAVTAAAIILPFWMGLVRLSFFSFVVVAQPSLHTSTTWQHRQTKTSFGRTKMMMLTETIYRLCSWTSSTTTMMTSSMMMTTTKKKNCSLHSTRLEYQNLPPAGCIRNQECPPRLKRYRSRRPDTFLRSLPSIGCTCPKTMSRRHQNRIPICTLSIGPSGFV